MVLHVTRAAECTVAIAGGGTAGHVFPAIAVAEKLMDARAPKVRVFWIGGAGGIEKRIVERAGMEFHGIPAGKLRRYLSLKNVTDVFRIAAGILASVRIMSREKPDLLFSKGGFVSVPPVLAARLLGIPSFTHESDFDPGLATRINLRFSEKALVSFPETIRFFPAKLEKKAVVTGNPVRSAFLRADPRRGRKVAGCGGFDTLLLVLGGSSGSRFVNELIASCLPALSRDYFVVHQTGQAAPAGQKWRNYLATPFFDEELPDVMAAADLVIGRAGANTLAELSALGKPSILIPLPSSHSRGDQLRNAEAFRKRGAALVLPESEATGETLLRAVSSLFNDRARLSDMGRSARGMCQNNSAAAIADLILRRIG